MTVDWSYFDKFAKITDKYLPRCGEGDTKATQIVTAVSKLVYKWYNDGDVFDNTFYLDGWANDLSSYANWLARYVGKARPILSKISACYSDDEYEELLSELADTLMEETYLDEQNKLEKVGTIYRCYGEFKFEEAEEDDI